MQKRTPKAVYKHYQHSSPAQAQGRVCVRVCVSCGSSMKLCLTVLKWYSKFMTLVESDKQQGEMLLCEQGPEYELVIASTML